MVEENCIVCALKHTIWFTSFSGIPGFFIECSHEDDDSKIKIIKSRLHFTTWLITLTLATALWFYSAMFVLTFNDPDIAVLFFTIINLSDLTTITSILIFSYRKSKHFENSLTITNTYLQRWKLAFREPLLTKENCLVDIVVLIMCYLWVALIVTSITSTIDYARPSVMLNKIAKLFTHVQVVMTISFNILLRTYRTICKNCQHFVKQKLDENASDPFGNQTNLTTQSYIVKLMKHYRLIYTMINKVARQFSMFYNPTLIIMFSAITFNPINSTLVVIYGSSSENYTMDEVWETPLQLFLVTLLSLISLKEYENFANMHNDFLSYLFKYPISKLHYKEALEIEITIKCIYRHKIEIKLAEILTPGAKLVAPYFGTILTYILVVVQFVKADEKAAALRANSYLNTTALV